MTHDILDEVIGHEAAKEAFTSAMQHDRLHHAWLLTGPSQIGKTRLARSFAKILLNATDPTSSAARRIAAGTHRDMITIRRAQAGTKTGESSTIVVADVKPVQQLLHLTAAEGGWRVIIVEGGDLLNIFAGNALLKLLEEPPEKTIFFIVADNESAVLSTIRSRCRKLRLQPLNDDAIKRFLTTVGVMDETECQELISHARGRPGYVLEHIAQKNQAVEHIVANLTTDGAHTLTTEQAERIAREERGFATFCDLLQLRIKDTALRCGREGDNHAASDAAETYRKLTRLRHETERFNLDKTRAALMAAALLDKI